MAASKLSLLMLAAATAVSAQASCPTTIPFPYRQPIIAPGYNVRLVAKDLMEPRQMAFDTEGNLLIAQNYAGVVSLSLKDDGGACVTVASKKYLTNTTETTHSIAIAEDGKTVYVTSVEALFAFDYDAKTQTLSTTNRTLVNNMTGTDHLSRTMMWSKKVPGTVVINLGSYENVDLEAANKESGHSNLRSFDLSNPSGSPIPWLQGKQVTWGTRNSVGIAEHPISGGVYSVENSVDNIARDGKDIHENNPGEELNFHGYLNGTVHPNYGANFGYPYCYTAWNVSEIPRNENLMTGSAFAMDSDDKKYDDNFCKTQTQAPRLTFPAHWAPLDIVFNPTGDTAWITAHGSWNRDDPSGYLLFTVAFDPVTGDPIAPPTAQDHITRIFENGFVGDCPDNCFRPVAMAWDKKGRLFMSSDLSNEVFVITKADGSGVADVKAPYPAVASTAAAPGASVAARSLAQGGLEASEMAKRAMIGAAFGAGAYGFAM